MFKLLVFACMLAVAVAAPKPDLFYSAYTAPVSAAYAPLAYSAPYTYAAYSAPYTAQYTAPYTAPYAAVSSYSYGVYSPYLSYFSK